jgi:hypothetical protein
VKKTVVLVCFVVALAAAVLVATDRARSMDADDTTPPVGWLSLPVAVPSIHVEVAAAVADPDSGVIELRLSNDGTTWSGWEGYPSVSPDGSIHVPWALSPGAGAKTVRVEVSNGAGLIATFTADTVLRPSSASRAGRAARAARHRAAEARFRGARAPVPIRADLPRG